MRLIALVTVLAIALPLAATAAPGWSVEHLAKPAGNTTELRGIDCPAISTCVAVGNDFRAGFAERWNGSAWVAGALALPPQTALNDIAAVSCPKADVCVAVGTAARKPAVRQEYPSSPLVETWKNGSWTAKLPPLPAGSKEGQLLGVDCASTAVCVAVGQYRTGSGDWFAFAEHWNGGTWKPRVIPSPSGSAIDGVLAAVSCPRPAFCLAVGGYHTSPTSRTAMAYRWDGAKWTAQEGVSPARSSVSFLDGVSCPAVRQCMAVGGYVNHTGRGLTLSARLASGGWRVLASPSARGADSNMLEGVVCRAANDCLAVGGAYRFSDRRPLAAYWDGNKWVAESPPAPAASDGSVFVHLAAVSCPTAALCFGVGSAYGEFGDEALAVKRS